MLWSQSFIKFWGSGMLICGTGMLILLLCYANMILWDANIGAGMLIWYSGMLIWWSGMLIWYSGMLIWYSKMTIWHCEMLIWRSELLIWYLGMLISYSEILISYSGMLAEQIRPSFPSGSECLLTINTKGKRELCTRHELSVNTSTAPTRSPSNQGLTTVIEKQILTAGMFHISSGTDTMVPSVPVFAS